MFELAFRYLALAFLVAWLWAPAALAQDEKNRAREHFDRGLEHLRANRHEPALAEFLRSRELYPTRANTQNLAAVLSKLERYDEALDVLEELTQKYKDLSADDAREVEREMLRLRGLVAFVEVSSTVRGAKVVIDGRTRGVTPLTKPIRVKLGSHSLRVFKEGAAPFDVSFEIAAGEHKTVTAELAVLEKSGRLQVRESSGARAEVVVDGVALGHTPFEGRVATGKHSVLLRGKGTLGTAPVLATVSEDGSTTLNLALVKLECELRIEPVPSNARVAVDAIEVGLGTWEGRLECGAHRTEVAADGFLPQTRSVQLTSGVRRVERVELERDPSSSAWQKRTPPRFFVELATGGVFGTTLGGDLADSCGSGCNDTPVLGGVGTLRGGYQLASGLSFGVSGGVLFARQTVEGREAVWLELPSETPSTGVADDRLSLLVFSFGVDAALQRGETWPWTLRVGAGVLLGSIEDRRESSSTLSGQPATYEPHTHVFPARYAYFAPEVRVGPAPGEGRAQSGLETDVPVRDHAAEVRRHRSHSRQRPQPRCVSVRRYVDGLSRVDAAAGSRRSLQLPVIHLSNSSTIGTPPFLGGAPLEGVGLELVFELRVAGRTTG
jgi:hypothetical protein